MSDGVRWQPIMAHAAAAGTVPWQYASLATGLIGVASSAIRGNDASPAAGLTLAVLQSALLLGGLWLGLRLRIDAVLFRALAEADGTDGFDRAMVELGLLDTARIGRPMPDRVAGLMRLVRRLTMVVVAQLAALVVTGWLAWR